MSNASTTPNLRVVSQGGFAENDPKKASKARILGRRVVALTAMGAVTAVAGLAGANAIKDASTVESKPDPTPATINDDRFKEWGSTTVTVQPGQAGFAENIAGAVNPEVVTGPDSSTEDRQAVIQAIESQNPQAGATVMVPDKNPNQP